MTNPRYNLQSYFERILDKNDVKRQHIEYSSRSIRLNSELDMVEIISIRDFDEGYSWHRSIVSYLIEESDFQSYFEKLLKQESVSLNLNALFAKRQARFDHSHKTINYEPSDEYQVSTGRGILSGRIEFRGAGGVYEIDLSNLRFEQQSTEENFVVSLEQESSQRIKDVVGRIRRKNET